MASDGSSGSAATRDVERMIKDLGLKEEDLHDVVYEEAQAPPVATRWMAHARVHMNPINNSGSKRT